MSKQAKLYTKKPPNAFVLYRSDTLRQMQTTSPNVKLPTPAQLSQLVAAAWHKELDVVKQEYCRRAESLKMEQQQPGTAPLCRARADHEDRDPATKVARIERWRGDVYLSSSSSDLEENPQVFVNDMGKNDEEARHFDADQFFRPTCGGNQSEDPHDFGMVRESPVYFSRALV